MDSRKLSSLLGKNVIEIREDDLSGLHTGFGGIRSLVAVCTHNDANSPSGHNESLSLIVKVINPPSGKGEGHERDIQSYIKEACFYENIAKSLIKASIAVPEPFHVDCDPSSGKTLILMSDLREQYDVHGSFNSMSFANGQLQASLEWAAMLHAYAWEQPALWERSGVWTEGNYWRLEVRRTEHQGMDKSRWARLQKAAPAVASLLQDGMHSVVASASDVPSSLLDSAKMSNVEDISSDAVADAPLIGKIEKNRFRTLIHGDYKGPNMMFSTKKKSSASVPSDIHTPAPAPPRPRSDPHSSSTSSSTAPPSLSCGVFDYQWVGGGYGSVDLVKLLVSCMELQDDTLEAGREVENQALAYYHERLLHYIHHFNALDASMIGTEADTLSASGASREEYEDKPPLSMARTARRTARSTDFSLAQLTKQYELCMVDYTRFLAGWKMVGHVNYAVGRTAEILAAAARGEEEEEGGEVVNPESLGENSSILSEEEYSAALMRYFRC